MIHMSLPLATYQLSEVFLSFIIIQYTFLICDMLNFFNRLSILFNKIEIFINFLQILSTLCHIIRIYLQKMGVETQYI